MIIAITQDGFVKKTPKSEFKAQKIGSNGVFRSFYADVIKTVREASLEDTLLLFTEQGKCYRMEVMDIPSTKISEKGISLKEKFGLVDDNFCAILPIKSDYTNGCLDDYTILISSISGCCVRHKLSDYTSMGKSKRVMSGCVASVSIANINDIVTNYQIGGYAHAFRLDSIPIICANSNGKGVKTAVITDKTSNITDIECGTFYGTSHILVTKSGYFNRIEPVRITSRSHIGTKMLKLQDGDSLVFGQMMNDDDDILMVTAKGFVFRTSISQFVVQQRCKKNIKCLNLSDNDYVVACCKMSPLKEITINSDKYIAYKQETEESQNLLSNIFNEVEENIVEYNNTSDVVLEVLEILFAKEIWSKEEVENICKSKGLITGAILEEINDYSYSMVDDAVVEDNGDTIYVMLNYKEELL